VVRRIHGALGMGAAVFIIAMVLSGLAINHSHGLRLDQRQVSLSFLLAWYGLGEPENIHSFELDGDWLSFAGSHLYLNGRHVSVMPNGLGVVRSNGMFIAASNEELLLLDPDGQLIERLPWGPAGAGGIEALGLLNDSIVTIKSSGQLWLTDADLMKWWQSADSMEVPVWASEVSAPVDLHQAIKRQYRGDSLSVERLLLDFHSGRLFGSPGVFVYDMLALAVGFLAISGVFFWLRGQRNGNRNSKHQGNGFKT